MLTGRQIFDDNRQRFDVAPATAATGRIATLSGYAIVWNVLSGDRGGYKVRLLPGSASFATPTLALHGHDFNQVIGNTKNRTLRVFPDSIGVRVEIDLPSTTLGRDLFELIGRGYVGGMSFQMDGGPLRSAERVEGGQKIVDVSSFLCNEVTVTAIPAFASTSIGVATPSAGFSTASRARLSVYRARLNMLRLMPT